MKRLSRKTNEGGKKRERPLIQTSLLAGVRGRHIRVIGIGGIGSSLAAYLARFLWSHHAKLFGVTLDLIDGDHCELKNKERMFLLGFQHSLNKAVAKTMELTADFGDRVLIRPVPLYVTRQNIRTLIGEKDMVFMAVDNFRTRKLVSAHCERLKTVVVFSGGNDGIENGQDGTFGNVQIYEKRNGQDLKNRITRFHPEIQAPQDKAPYEMSCEELATSSAPQLLFTNLAVASAMLNAFYSWLHNRLDYEEAYIDVMSGCVRPSCREVAKSAMINAPPKRASPRAAKGSL